MSRRVRVRFAPSPTGPLHMGGIRTALYNYLLAKQQGGDFILRIEDTDQNRFVPGAEKYIIDSLKWCGIEPNEGIGFGDGPHAPYRQSERKALYKEYADKLIASDHAYYAFDTPEDLELMRANMQAQGVPNPAYNAVTRQYMKNSITLPKDEVESKLANNEPYVVRFKMPRNEEVKFHDEVRGWVVFNTSQLDDKVLFKSDGMPTYHLANVADDYMMQITHVIRGEEWLSSAPLHVLLYRAFGWEDIMPKFAHLSLILKPDGNGKLSKRDGDRLGFPSFALNWTDPETGETSTGYRERGFFSEAFINFLSLLGWNPGGDKELMTKDEMIKLI
jgi:glutamyl-tRNA synthetase